MDQSQHQHEEFTESSPKKFTKICFWKLVNQFSRFLIKTKLTELQQNETTKIDIDKLIKHKNYKIEHYLDDKEAFISKFLCTDGFDHEFKSHLVVVFVRSKEFEEITHTLIKLKSMKDRICACASMHGGYIFGGHVRDLFEFVTERDIDIKFNDETWKNSFLTIINKMFTVYASIPKIKYGLQIETLSIRDKNDEHILCSIDVVLDMDCLTTEGDFQVHMADFDVNMLYLDLNNKIQVTKTNGFKPNKIEIFKHIIDKVFTLVPKEGFDLTTFDPNEGFIHRCKSQSNKYGIVEFTDCPDCVTMLQKTFIQLRIHSMTLRGWKLLSAPCENPACILCPEKVRLAFQDNNKKKCEDMKRYYKQMAENDFIGYSNW